MLFSKPPAGYNTSSINQQQVSPYNYPGRQGDTAQGYFANQYRSSYSTPSSYSVPSSVNMPNPYYSGGSSSPMNMVRALMRR